MIVEMNDDALENYGEKYRGVRFAVTHRATRYMKASEFFARGKPDGYHPGYDSGSGNVLYDLRRVDTDEDLPMSLYGWELDIVEQ